MAEDPKRDLFTPDKHGRSLDDITLMARLMCSQRSNGEPEWMRDEVDLVMKWIKAGKKALNV